MKTSTQSPKQQTESSHRFDVILADPPWQFEVWNRDTGNGRSAEAHYSTMTIEEICNLPVADLAADNCALFLWCCWPSILDYAPKVLAAWGFRYATNAFVWVKLKRRWYEAYLPMAVSLGQHNILSRLFHLGMGYYSRANTEPCLLGIKGKMPVFDRSISELIVSPIQEHSRKPDEQYPKIEALYPGMSYVELFARRKRPGWSAWGNQVKSDIALRIEDTPSKLFI